MFATITTTGIEFGDRQEIELGELDAILMRKDPPFDMEYVYTTYILDRAQRDGALIVNAPQALRDMNEKAYTAWFPQCTPTTLITRSMDDMKAFLAEHGRVVVKPLDGMGGRSIFVVKKGDKNANVIFETLTDYGRNFAMAQVYIPEITRGDKRILLIDGEARPLRAGAHSDWRRQSRQSGRRGGRERAGTVGTRRRNLRAGRPCSA